MRTEALLVFLLRLGAAVLLLALIAVVMPFGWMAVLYRGLGLEGELPALPLVSYLTRSLSLVYALWGVMFWYVANDVRRYLPFVRLLGLMNVILGAFFVPLDLLVGLPTYWVLCEGPVVLVYGALVWWAARHLEAASLV